MAATFHWADYVVFTLSLALSSGIGIFYAIRDRNTKTAEDFLMAGRNMHVIPVAVSLFVSWISAISFLGDPTEVYMYGAVYWLIGAGYVLAIPVVAHVFAPKFYRLKQISAYQFLKQQYNVHMRTFASVAMGFKMFVYLGVALYAPCMALSQMSGLDTRLCILVVGGICTFYTSLGGMKAVLWADTVQALIMFSGMLACLIQGVISVGGMEKVINIAREGNRFSFTNLDPNPLVRATVWSYLIGGFFRVLSPYASSQVFIQRYCTVKSERDMKIALYINIPLFVTFVMLFGLIGLTMFAYFKDCDPLLQGRVEKADQIMPLMVMETLGHLPGIPGLFLACICSAALSTISSGQNALSATTLDDIIQPLHKKLRGTTLSVRASKLIAMVLSLTFGVLNIALSFLVLTLKNTTIFALSSKIVGSLAGPIAGLFILAILCPSVDPISAVLGCFIAIAVLVWLVIGGSVDPPPFIFDPRLALTTKGCVHNDTWWGNVSSLSTANTTLYTTTTDGLDMVDEGFAINHLYRLNPILFGVFGFVLTFLIGLILAGLTRLVKRRSKTSEECKMLDELKITSEMAPLKTHTTFELTTNVRNL